MKTDLSSTERNNGREQRNAVLTFGSLAVTGLADVAHTLDWAALPTFAGDNESFVRMWSLTPG